MRRPLNRPHTLADRLIGLLQLLWVGGVYLVLYLPILILVIFSFNADPFPASWSHFTWKWYAVLMHNQEIWHALSTSRLVACCSTALAFILSLTLIFCHAGGQHTGRKGIDLFYGNLIVPETMLALSLLSYFTFLQIEMGLLTLIIAHAILGLGFMIPAFYARWQVIDPRLIEASRILGASPSITFHKIVVPLLRPTLFAVSLLVFTLSFDDLVFSYFCAGHSVQTLSLYLLGMLRLGVSPMMNALATCLLGLSVVLVCFVVLFYRQERRRLF